jgi:FixJ family two-component response regulator
MHPRTMLILEDDDDRVRGLQNAVASLGAEFGVRIWRDAPDMIEESPACFAKACLISLDHDLQPLAGEADPGTGLDVAEFLSLHAPRCPVILHTSNCDGRLAMHIRLRAGGWTVATVPPREADWIQASWLPISKRLIGLCNSPRRNPTS